MEREVPMKHTKETIQTNAEKKLVKALRAKKLSFYENYLIEDYEVDLWFPEYKLAIEVDGYFHLSEGQRKTDLYKEQVLLSKGIILIRFDNQEIRNNTNQCVTEIIQILAQIHSAKDHSTINFHWKESLRKIKIPNPPPTVQKVKSIEDYFLSIDDKTE